jgi:Tol biopolymer transport system component
MVVTAPSRPPRLREFRESEQLEALIEEARRRARQRRLRYAASVLLAAGAGTVAVLGLGRGGGEGTAAPRSDPVPAWEIKLAGGRLAYVQEHEQGLLYVTKPDGSGARALARCGQWIALCVIKNPVWSPDGRQIAFLRGRQSSPNDAGNLALYVIGLDGHGERRLSNCGGIDGECGATWGSRLSWSPDGSQIAFTRGGVLSVVEVRSARVRQLTRCEQSRCFEFNPAWSPDQTAIAFTRLAEKDALALYRVSVRGSRVTRLAADGLNPAWAPDGKTILVDSRDGIASVSADGSGRTLLVAGSRGNGPGVPSWSPDGRRVLYFWTPRETLGYRPEVWMMNPDGTGKKRVFRGSCCVDVWFKPVWSADGSRVAFSTNVGGTFVVGADGTHLRNLTGLTADLAWQPAL